MHSPFKGLVLLLDTSWIDVDRETGIGIFDI